MYLYSILLGPINPDFEEDDENFWYNFLLHVALLLHYYAALKIIQNWRNKSYISVFKRSDSCIYPC